MLCGTSHGDRSKGLFRGQGAQNKLEMLGYERIPIPSLSLLLSAQNPSFLLLPSSTLALRSVEPSSCAGSCTGRWVCGLQND